jgi:hypothetical protein
LKTLLESSKSQDTGFIPKSGEPAHSPPLTLKIRGCGNVAAFKNAKRISGDRLITDRGMKARMQAIQRALESELRSASTLGIAETSMAARRQFLTLFVPRDDCWTNIPELIVTGELVADGEEGFDITIERLP